MKWVFELNTQKWFRERWEGWETLFQREITLFRGNESEYFDIWKRTRSNVMQKGKRSKTMLHNRKTFSYETLEKIYNQMNF